MYIVSNYNGPSCPQIQVNKLYFATWEIEFASLNGQGGEKKGEQNGCSKENKEIFDGTSCDVRLTRPRQYFSLPRPLLC